MLNIVLSPTQQNTTTTRELYTVAAECSDTAQLFLKYIECEDDGSHACLLMKQGLSTLNRFLLQLSEKTSYEHVEAEGIHRLAVDACEYSLLLVECARHEADEHDAVSLLYAGLRILHGRVVLLVNMTSKGVHIVNDSKLTGGDNVR